MLGLVIVLVSGLVACKSEETRKPRSASAGPPAVGSCDYRSEVLDGKRHSCLEIYDATAVELHAGWCNELSGPRDHPTFRKGQGCPLEGRRGGCLFPNGTVSWQYEGKPSCMGAMEFKDAPTIEKATPYRCATPKLCRETMSVFDMTKTVDKQNCESGGGTFEMGTCSADQVAGRCATRSRFQDTTWVYYAPMTTEQAKQHCETMPGTFTPP